MAGRRIMVVGAGITGLTVAHRPVVDHPHLDVTILEASTVTGGKLRTTPLAALGIDIGEGADAFPVSYTHLRAHETREDFVCPLTL